MRCGAYNQTKKPKRKDKDKDKDKQKEKENKLSLYWPRKQSQKGPGMRMHQDRRQS